MATTHVYGPYYVITSLESKFRPGELRHYGFGPWPDFAKGTASISANIQDFSRLEEGKTRQITIDEISYELRGFDRYINFSYRNSGSDEIQGWYFNLSVSIP